VDLWRRFYPLAVADPYRRALLKFTGRIGLACEVSPPYMEYSFWRTCERDGGDALESVCETIDTLYDDIWMDPKIENTQADTGDDYYNSLEYF
jgi:hypothetical protein